MEAFHGEEVGVCEEVGVVLEPLAEAESKVGELLCDVGQVSFAFDTIFNLDPCSVTSSPFFSDVFDHGFPIATDCSRVITLRRMISCFQVSICGLIYVPFSVGSSIAGAVLMARVVVSTGWVGGSSLVVWMPSSGKRRAWVRTRDSSEPTPSL